MKRKPNRYWSYERCKEESLKYENGTIYNIIHKNKWFELTEHFKTKNH